MQEVGFTSANPENLEDFDEYWVRAAMIMHEIDNDPTLQKARENMAKRKQGKKASKKRGASRNTATGAQLQAVPNTH